jgi:NAD+ kinase
MKIFIYAKAVKREQIILFKRLFGALNQKEIDFLVSETITNTFQKNVLQPSNKYFTGIFKDFSDLDNLKPDFMICVGGDGTFLESLLLIRDSGIPVLGLNIGRLGFLNNNTIDDLENIFTALLNKEYILEARTVLQIESNKPLFKSDSFALNDFTIHKRESSSLAAIATYLNDEFFNIYWSDGVVVSTPTGSTAYSMSCGGPIVFPQANTFTITPVAPHNLNMRPVVVPDDIVISFEIKGREKKLMISLDSRCQIIDHSVKIRLFKAPFHLNTVRFKEQNFSRIIREKLMWGKDNRNI